MNVKKYLLKKNIVLNTKYKRNTCPGKTEIRSAVNKIAHFPVTVYHLFQGSEIKILNDSF